MDEEGFKKHFMKKKRSPRGAEIYIKMLKKYKNFLHKYRNHEDIDLSSKGDLQAFSKWLKEENFQQPMLDMYKVALREYFIFINKEKLAKKVEKELRG
jgi:site-specific recombinase XerD